MNQTNRISIIKSGVLACLFLFALSSATPPPQNSPLKVRQTGRTLLLSFPPLQNRSALKVIDLQGNLVKGALVDERLTQFALPLEQYKSGLHQVSLENRVQRYSVKVLLQ
ncbi:MAG TPA: hypothetical protein PKE63_06955 [Lacibacter sp.]|nr:hypothetical protein [Lacibacter sp.]HMO90184.1 hypothetical protein [Lacibacter sp.]HMP86999.1 hypothetical protein [Lacibacter sp.]